MLWYVEDTCSLPAMRVNFQENCMELGVTISHGCCIQVEFCSRTSAIALAGLDPAVILCSSNHGLVDCDTKA